MNADFAALLYLVSGVLFILALRGLSSPETSRQGNIYGMIGMAIAIGTTLSLVTPDATTWTIIAIAIAIGGGVGALIARSIKMTAMPQLVAAFHSLVGLAAVAVAAAAFYAPESFDIALPLGIAGAERGIKMQSLIELSLGTAIGAVTLPAL
jgi:NAD(P) transhydrogenase subunit beta